MTELVYPKLTMKTPQSAFTVTCHGIAWHQGYGGKIATGRRARYHSEKPGLLFLDLSGSDTAIRALRAALYAPDVVCAFKLDEPETTLVKAQAGDGCARYIARTAKLCRGVVHLRAYAAIPGLMLDLSEESLWRELTSPRYTTPLLRSWMPWLKQRLIEAELLIEAEGITADPIGVLQMEDDQLDEVVSSAVRQRALQIA